MTPSPTAAVSPSRCAPRGVARPCHPASCRGLTAHGCRWGRLGVTSSNGAGTAALIGGGKVALAEEMIVMPPSTPPIPPIYQPCGSSLRLRCVFVHNSAPGRTHNVYTVLQY